MCYSNVSSSFPSSLAPTPTRADLRRPHSPYRGRLSRQRTLVHPSNDNNLRTTCSGILWRSTHSVQSLRRKSRASTSESANTRRTSRPTACILFEPWICHGLALMNGKRRPMRRGSCKDDDQHDVPTGTSNTISAARYSCFAHCEVHSRGHTNT